MEFTKVLLALMLFIGVACAAVAPPPPPLDPLHPNISAIIPYANPFPAFTPTGTTAPIPRDPLNTAIATINAAYTALVASPSPFPPHPTFAPVTAGK